MLIEDDAMVRRKHDLLDSWSLKQTEHYVERELHYCLVYRRCDNHLRDMTPANKVYRHYDDQELQDQ
jgi:hypothetical protein